MLSRVVNYGANVQGWVTYYDSIFIDPPCEDFAASQNINVLRASRLLGTYFKTILKLKKSLSQNLCLPLGGCWEI